MNTAEEPLQITITPINVPVPPAGAYMQTILTALDINLTNPATATSAVSLTEVGVLLPSAFLVSNVSPQASQPLIWDFGPISTPGAYVATSVSGSPNDLQPGSGFDFTLNVTVPNQPIESFSISVKVQFSDGSTVTKHIPMQMVQVTNSIVSFKPSKGDINPGESSTLTWVTTGIDYCILSPFSAQQQPASGSQNVDPNFTQTYTLDAYAPGILLSAQATVSVDSAYAEIGSNGVTSVNYGQNVTLNWLSNAFTGSVIITCDDPDIVIPDNLPVSGSANFGPLTHKAFFTLTPYGLDGNAYYPAIIEITVNDPTVTFTASPDTGLWSLDKIVITWDVVSAESFSISPAFWGAPSPLPASGSFTVYAIEDVTYTLTAIGTLDASGNPTVVTKDIKLSIAPVTLTTFTTSPDIIDFQSGDANQCTLTWVANAQVVSINQGIGAVGLSGSQVIKSPANGAVYTLTAGTNQNPSILTQSVTIQNMFGPFHFNSFAPDPEIPALVQFPVNDSAILLNVDNLAFSVALTGVKITNISPQPQLGALYASAEANPFFGVLSFPPTNPPINPQFEWIDPNNQTGTITITGLFGSEGFK